MRIKRSTQPFSVPPVGWPTMGVVLASLCLDGSHRAAAEGFHLDLTLAGRFDEQPIFPSESNWVGSVVPGVGYTRHAVDARYDFEARRRFDSLMGDASPRPTSDVGRLSFLGAASEDLEWELGGRYYRARDPLDQDPSHPSAPGISESGGGKARVSGWRGEASYEAQASRHTAERLTDAWSQAASTTLFPMRTPQGAWLLRARYQDWSLNDTRALSALVGTAGYRRHHTPHLWSEAEMGVVSQGRTEVGDEQRVAWAVTVQGLAGVLGLPFDSRIHVGRDVATMGEAELRRDVGGVKIQAGYAHAVAAEGGRFTVPSVRDRASLGLENARLPLTLSIDGSYSRSKPREGAGDTIETYRGTAGLSRALNPRLSSRVSYSHLRQQESNGADFHRGRAEVAVTATWP